MAGTEGRNEYRFDVAFTFAGQHRERMLAIADLVSRSLEPALADRGKGRVFLDTWFEPELNGPDGDNVLERVYTVQSLMVVEDVSEDYSNRPWCQVEARAVRSLRLTLNAAADEAARLRIAYIRFDDGEVPGVLPTTLVWDAREKSNEELADLILRRLHLLGRGPGAPPRADEGASEGAGFALPRRAPLIAAGVAVLACLHYVGAVFHDLPWRAALTKLFNEPNFAVFSLLCMPVSIGLTVAILAGPVARRLPRWAWLLLAGLMVFSPLVTLSAVIGENRPLLPEQVRLPPHGADGSSIEEFLHDVEQLRGRVFPRTDAPFAALTPAEAIGDYCQRAAAYLDTEESAMSGFTSLADLLRRGSWSTFAAIGHSMLSGIATITLYWTLLMLWFVQKSKVPKVDRQRAAVALILFYIWFPCRLYNLWYSHFYALDSFGKAPVVLFIIALCASVLVMASFRPSRPVLWLSAIVVAFTLVFGFVVRQSADSLRPLGRVLGDLDLVEFAAAETALGLLLVALTFKLFQTAAHDP